MFDRFNSGQTSGESPLRSVSVLAIAIAAFVAVIVGIVFGGPALVRVAFPDTDVPSITLGDLVDGVLDLAGGSSFDDDAADDDEPSPSPTPTATEEPTPTPAPTVALEGITGTPHSATAVVNAWRGAGLQVEQEPLEGDGFSGLAGEAVGLRLSEGSGALLVAVIVYPDSDAVREDWSIQSGEAPRLREGRNIPGLESVWWNRNVVVAVLERGGPTGAALDAFIGMGR